MKNLSRVQNKSALSLGSVTLTICLLGKLTTRLTGYSKRLIVKMACLTVKDIEAALNLYLSVRDWETLTESIQIPKMALPMAYARLTELTLQENEVSFIFHSLVIVFYSLYCFSLIFDVSSHFNSLVRVPNLWMWLLIVIITKQIR